MPPTTLGQCLLGPGSPPECTLTAHAPRPPPPEPSPARTQGGLASAPLAPSPSADPLPEAPPGPPRAHPGPWSNPTLSPRALCIPLIDACLSYGRALALGATLALLLARRAP